MLFLTGSGRFGLYLIGNNFPKSGLEQSIEGTNGVVKFFLDGGTRSDTLNNPCYGFTPEGKTRG